jgi:hypothetical protein
MKEHAQTIGLAVVAVLIGLVLYEVLGIKHLLAPKSQTPAGGK